MASDDKWANISTGEYGWLGQLTLVRNGTAQDISTYTTLEFIFVKPDGTTFARSAEFATDGTDGVLQYVTADGDIDVRGHWRVYAHIARTAPPASLYSAVHRFTVGA